MTVKLLLTAKETAEFVGVSPDTAPRGRRYRGCDITPGPIFTSMCDDGARRPLHDGWVATCPCGWTGRRFTQTLLRQAITDHQWYGRPTKCTAAKP